VKDCAFVFLRGSAFVVVRGSICLSFIVLSFL